MSKIIMENIQKKGDATPTPGEETEEEVPTINEDDIRSKVIEDYDLDDDEQYELIDKLTLKEVEQRKAFGKVIEQKRKWREQAQSTKEETTQPPKEQGEDVRAIIRDEFSQKYIEDLDYPDEVKDEIKRVMKATGKDVKEVSKDPYILHKKEEILREAKNTSASPNSARKGNTIFDENNPPKFDMSTEEGREQFKDWKKQLIEQE